MAESEPNNDIQAAGQHYLVCGTQDCEENCQFYCNTCHQPMCEGCRDKHLKRADTQKHEVVLYRQRKHQLPVEKCKIHPSKDIDLLCDDCNVPICSKCSTTQDHLRHKFVDLETIYTTNCGICQEKIRQIHQHFLPTCKELSQATKEDTSVIKKIMDDIRASLKAEGESLRKLVETTTSEKIEHVNEMEKSLMKMLQNQEKTYQDYNMYLNELVKEFDGYLSSTQFGENPMISTISGSFSIQPIPETNKLVPPKFTAGQQKKNDTDKLFGAVNIPSSKAEKRVIVARDMALPQLRPTEEGVKPDVKKMEEKPRVPLSSLVTEVKQCKVSGVLRVCHRSLSTSGRFWVSDRSCSLVQIDLEGKLLQEIKTIGGQQGYHTATQDGDLIYADKGKNVINRITNDKSVTEFIKTRDWIPLSIHSSKINGDILVGMKKNLEAKITRYDKTGKELQSLQKDNTGVELYRYPHYITENINGDICASDDSKNAVVVVNKSGKHRFSYTGQQSTFYPHGICTNSLGHIIVCNGHYANEKVDILDQDGRFLGCLLTPKQWVGYPCGVCVDDENNLYVGEYKANLAKVYQYLQSL